ncbi:694_t:CDS:1, partial [Dentiscutata heterogama]
MYNKVEIVVEAIPEAVDKIKDAVKTINSSDKTSKEIVVITSISYKLIPQIVTSVSILVNEISQIFEKAQCNKNICSALNVRVRNIDIAVKFLSQRIEKDNKESEKICYQLISQFKILLEKIKIYAIDISQIQRVKLFSN